MKECFIKLYVKFIYSEKATKYIWTLCISRLDTNSNISWKWKCKWSRNRNKDDPSEWISTHWLSGVFSTGALAPAILGQSIIVTSLTTRNFGTVYYCQHPQFKSPKYAPDWGNRFLTKLWFFVFQIQSGCVFFVVIVFCFWYVLLNQIDSVGYFFPDFFTYKRYF